VFLEVPVFFLTAMKATIKIYDQLKTPTGARKHQVACVSGRATAVKIDKWV
jgi:hypothetical protein